MKKKTYQINIPEPCNEDWNKMTPQEQGRFCGKCEKIIVDYTLQPDRVIAKALKAKNGQICGRFRSDQLQRDLVFEPQFYQNTRWKAFGLMLSGLLAAGTLKGEEPLVISPTTVLDEDFYQTKADDAIIISGRVVDEETGEGLIGASVILEGLETTTNLDGHFGIEIFSKELRFKILTSGVLLEVDYIDYYKKESYFLRHTLKKGECSDLENIGIKNLDFPIFKVPTIKLSATFCGIDDGTIIIASEGGKRVFMGAIDVSPIYASSIMDNPFLDKDSLWLKTVVSKIFKKEKQQPKKENTPTETLAYAAIEPTSQKVSKAKKPQNKELPFLPKIIQRFYPNPFIDRVNIELQVEKLQTYHLVIFNELGQEVQGKVIETVIGFNQFTIHIDKKYPSGTYLLSLLNGQEVLQTEVIIKK